MFRPTASAWPDCLDAALCTLVFWALFRILRKRRQSYRVLVGIALVGLSYVLTHMGGLAMSSSALLALFVIGVIVVVIAVQDDLRRALESLTLFRRPATPPPLADVVVRAVRRMAHAKVGALILLPGREPLLPHVSGGVAIDALLSEPLLLSLFDPNSPGHDGAVMIANGKVERFAVHLPLSQNEEALDGRGTRHASALGISERTDTLAVVVSEERGQISLASQGTLSVVDEAGLRAGIARHMRGVPGPCERVSWRTRLLEVALAVGATACMWFAMVPGAVIVTRTMQVPVQFENLPEGFEADGSPVQVNVTLSGPRRAIYLLGEQEVEVALDAWFASAGKRVFAIERGDVHVPADLEVLDVTPRRVALRVRPAGL